MWNPSCKLNVIEGDSIKKQTQREAQRHLLDDKGMG